MMSSYETYGLKRHASVGRRPLRTDHDIVFTDTDSGVSLGLTSMKCPTSLTSLISPRAVAPESPRHLTRCHSLTQLPRDNSADSPLSPRSPYDASPGKMRKLRDKLDESEERRTLLMTKLKDAHATMQVQTDRLNKIETTAKDNNTIVEDLKIKEKLYREKMASMEKDQKESEILREENTKLRNDMQSRILSLDGQLKVLQTQHASSEKESGRRAKLLKQMTTALAELQQENYRMREERDTAHGELRMTLDAIKTTKSQLTAVDDENERLKNEIRDLKAYSEERDSKHEEFDSKLEELQITCTSLRADNERLSRAWQISASEKEQLVQQLDLCHVDIREQRSQIVRVSGDKDRILREKLDLHDQLQKALLDNEHLTKTKESLEEELSESQTQDKVMDEEARRRIDDELQAVNKVSEGLSGELTVVKRAFEQAQEQISLLEKGKQLRCQRELSLQQEVTRLQAELVSAQNVKDEHSLEQRVGEGDTGQVRCNKDQTSGESVEVWREKCERTEKLCSIKEEEIKVLLTRISDLDSTTVQLKEDARAYQGEIQRLIRYDEDNAQRLTDENATLRKQKAENEEMLRLLEAQMTLLKQQGPQANASERGYVERIEAFSRDNATLQQRLREVGEEQVDMDRLNKILMARIRELEIENTSLANYDCNNNSSWRDLERERDNLKTQLSNLRKEYDALKEQNAHVLQQDSPHVDSAANVKHLLSERDSLESHVKLLATQLTASESARKKAEEVIDDERKKIEEVTRNKQECESTIQQLESDLRLVQDKLTDALHQNDKQTDTIVSLKQQLNDEQNQKNPQAIQTSLDSAGHELTEMRAELQKLLTIINNKDAEILLLGHQLRASHDQFTTLQPHLADNTECKETDIDCDFRDTTPSSIPPNRPLHSMPTVSSPHISSLPSSLDSSYFHQTQQPTFAAPSLPTTYDPCKTPYNSEYFPLSIKPFTHISRPHDASAVKSLLSDTDQLLSNVAFSTSNQNNSNAIYPPVSIELLSTYGDLESNPFTKTLVHPSTFDAIFHPNTVSTINISPPITDRVSLSSQVLTNENHNPIAAKPPIRNRRYSSVMLDHSKQSSNDNPSYMGPQAASTNSRPASISHGSEQATRNMPPPVKAKPLHRRLSQPCLSMKRTELSGDVPVIKPPCVKLGPRLKSLISMYDGSGDIMDNSVNDVAQKSVLDMARKQPPPVAKKPLRKIPHPDCAIPNRVWLNEPADDSARPSDQVKDCLHRCHNNTENRMPGGDSTRIIEDSKTHDKFWSKNVNCVADGEKISTYAPSRLDITKVCDDCNGEYENKLDRSGYRNTRQLDDDVGANPTAVIGESDNVGEYFGRRVSSKTRDDILVSCLSKDIRPKDMVLKRRVNAAICALRGSESEAGNAIERKIDEGVLNISNLFDKLSV